MGDEKRRPTIGFVIDWIESSYYKRLQSGMNQSALDHKVNLLTFVGGGWNSPRNHEAPRNIIYNYISPENVDGLIISTGTLGHYGSQDQIVQFIRKMAPLPIVSLSEILEGVPSVISENTGGMEALLSHLSDQHGYKRIAFIKGPETNNDAQERYTVFTRFLESRNLSLKECPVFNGDFTPRGGALAVEKMIKKGAPYPRVIVASNDDMALGAIEKLKKEGFHVPGDVAVVGFDDQSLSRHINPPLTTVRQAVDGEGYTAIEVILRMIKGEEVPGVTRLPTELIIRESCGCLLYPMIRREMDGADEVSGPEGTSEICAEVLDVLKRVPSTLPGDFDCEQISLLVEAFYTSLKEEDPGAFNLIFNSVLEKEVESVYSTNHWQGILAALRTHLNRGLKSAKDLKCAGDIWYSAQIILSRHTQRLNDFISASTESEFQMIRDIGEELVARLEMDEISALFNKALPHIGIRGFFLSIYDDMENRQVENSSLRLVLGFNRKGEVRLEERDSYFRAIELLPSRVLEDTESFSFIVEPVFWNTTHTGIALFELGDPKSNLTNIMRRMFINSILKGAVFLQKIQGQALWLEREVGTRTEALSKANTLLTQLYQERKKAEAEVRKLNEELEERVVLRTRELTHTLETLKSTQNKLVQSEKMAALGGLVAGIAHEINTPMGISVTAASHLEKMTRDVLNSFYNNNLKKSELEKYFSTCMDASTMVLSNLRRAYDQIRSFKKIAVDQSNEEIRVFKLAAYIDEILMSLQPKLKKTNHRVRIICSRDLELKSHPGAFSQIITNLVMNSLIHGFREGEDGQITFYFKKKDPDLEFRYSDNGKGIKPNIIDKIFDPFFTTNRSKGGTGLGLNILYNIVTQSLKGSIRCVSRAGKGTTFVIKTPLILSPEKEPREEKIIN